MNTTYVHQVVPYHSGTSSISYSVMMRIYNHLFSHSEVAPCWISPGGIATSSLITYHRANTLIDRVYRFGKFLGITHLLVRNYLEVSFILIMIAHPIHQIQGHLCRRRCSGATVKMFQVEPTLIQIDFNPNGYMISRIDNLLATNSNSPS
jgi:hypothetical protein